VAVQTVRLAARPDDTARMEAIAANLVAARDGRGARAS